MLSEGLRLCRGAALDHEGCNRGGTVPEEEWLRGLVSQSVVLWDTARLRVRRAAKGHTRITLLPEPAQTVCRDEMAVQPTDSSPISL
jgi:hypothetical protein